MIGIKFQKLGTLLLASMLLIAGCGSPGSESADSASEFNEDSTGPITFTFFGADASPNWNHMQDDVGKEITAQTGVTLHAEYDVGSGGGQSKIALMAASGQFPDLIYAKGELGKLVDAGAFIDLTELIDKYAPNIKKIMGKNTNRMKYSKDDPAIYAIPTNIGVDGYGISITTACQDPVRAIKFMDWLSSEEGQVLRNWGIEGKHYNVEDGKRVIPADVLDKKVNDAANFSKQTGIELYAVFGVRYGDGVKDSTGNYYTTRFPEQIIASYSDAEKETLAAYQATTWKDLFPSEKDFPVKEWGALYNMQVPTDGNYQIIYQKTQDIVRKRIPEAILVKPADFDKVYDAFIDELNKAGAEKMEKEYSELVKARVSLFTGKDVQ
ncbi:extracellular solute-binding protein [Paenibacillus macerans]|uniref:extracellular solute-binding protein n=1 Tax=Paenibacillus macerans TaxID=44252 RepID=UPI002041F37D|nr:extracellular solute-binding protein [Paenibacillus macerans]MCM3703015.1 extracellular solute-binding protein [Paenibacillus macerans]